MKKITLLFLSLAFSIASFAEIKMPKIFSDNMLLQRHAYVKIWGKADANAKVDVEFAGQQKSAKADAKGNWSLRLDKMPANKNPQEMKISENGKLGKTIKNILVGEVWVAGGQSNMQWSIYHTNEYKNFLARKNRLSIRYFNQNTKSLSLTPAWDCPEDAKWTDIASAEKVGWFSATGLYFAEKLSLELDVPVAIVFTALGASKMICWLPEEKMESLPYLKSEWEKFKTDMATYDYQKAYSKWKEDVAQWEKDAQLAKKQKKPFNTKKPFEPHKHSCLKLMNQTPVYLYNALIAPIANYTLRGVIWYQGESDSYGGTLDNFQYQFDLIVKTWREKFGNPSLHFVYSQLTSFGTGGSWGLTRWKQYLSSKSLKNASVVNIIDLGQADDVHSRDKDLVGERFAKVALEKVYNKKVNGLCPELKSVVYNNDTATIKFNTYGRGIIGKGEPRGFEIRTNGKWQKATASLSGERVIVKSPNAEKIEAVRYLWKNWAKPDVWLFNKDGLPVFSFTDPENLASLR
ncbi:MAG: sialate O-acetylesterase [Opitutales bacterium]|nr:sialate O-acetylesterase [Opitutales bacterium]